MVTALVILTAAYLVIAALIALNSVLEAERARLSAKDILVVALVSATWPVVGCALLPMQACRKLRPRKRELLSAAR
ncbi:hypothetical protein [Bosea sp. (in: a-proteobacteria)]|jgi:hypothetical protein|uniref:hypothetical protein n=1 Tax=Bosea sp. (in: a-proteobacteria) TaxID=1871050 RepID=UPI002DDD5296|nr:hypothetical protein [Bosea sp. (in: a-proteobacteria)]HEV2509958.1 hypothetical protein [Bosea sp. (in: a-proteobacteria)]